MIQQRSGTTCLSHGTCVLAELWRSWSMVHGPLTRVMIWSKLRAGQVEALGT